MCMIWNSTWILYVGDYVARKTKLNIKKFHMQYQHVCPLIMSVEHTKCD